MDEVLIKLVQELSTQLVAEGKSIVTVESCTGGSVAALFTSLAGSSAWFDRGFVTYSNQSKIDMVGVSEKTLNEYGAVSEAVAREMALGGISNSEADYAISITGIAGPDGGTQEKPVGSICFAWAGFAIEVVTELCYFKGDRQLVRDLSRAHSIKGVLSNLSYIS